MWTDKFDQIILDEDDLFHAYMVDPQKKVTAALINKEVVFHSDLELSNKPNLVHYFDTGCTIEEFDKANQQCWIMPDEYKNLDIAAWLLDKCTKEEELQRVGIELLLYQERDLFNLLRYLKYLVDTMRKYGIVWGVGRGSSVSSYVLFLLGIHKIDSIWYDLDPHEFLK
jgi:DNA polymerase III alpha subunit